VRLRRGEGLGIVERRAAEIAQLLLRHACRVGRRVGVAIGLIILFVGTIMQAVPTVNDNMFIAGRFLVGLGYVRPISRASALC
jgi:MFS family permease